MGGRSSKTKPARHEAEITAVEVFEERHGEPESTGRRKRAASNQSGQVKVVRTVKKPISPVDGDSAAAAAQTQDKKGVESGAELEADSQTTKKKRRRSKKEKRRSQPAKLVHAKTTLNGIRDVSPPPRRDSGSTQKHFELIKDAYALDEDATKAVPFTRPDLRSRFFSFDNWRKTPQPLAGKGSTRTVLSPVVAPPLLRSKTAPMQEKKEPVLDSSGRHPSSHDTKEAFVHENDNEDILKDPEELERTGSTGFSGASRVRSGATVGFQDSTTQARQPDLDGDLRAATPSPPTETQRSGLHLDDFDEDLMENILSDNSDGNES